MSKKRLKNESFCKSVSCALSGLVSGPDERNIKIHLTAFVLAAFLGVLLDISVMEWLIILLVSAFVVSLELMNSSIEEICDKLRDDLGLSYESTRRARDVAAGAVLIAALAALSCGVIIFLPKIITLLISYSY